MFFNRFLSFGISGDYTFDVDLANQLNCKGMGFDPTVNHHAKVHGNVWFIATGANTLTAIPESWIATSML